LRALAQVFGSKIRLEGLDEGLVVHSRLPIGSDDDTDQRAFVTPRRSDGSEISPSITLNISISTTPGIAAGISSG
jgi:hypothetical protein